MKVVALRNWSRCGSITLVLFTAAAFAQQPPMETGAVVSEPGRVAAAETVTASVVVTAIDKATRGITLKTSDGDLFTVRAGDEVRNFDQIRVHDEVAVTYVRALSLQVRKSTGIRERSERAEADRAGPGEKPGIAGSRQITIVADVIDVNPRRKTITLKGPHHDIVELDVRNPDHFKVVKKGDQVVAVYTEAIAIAIVSATPRRSGR